MTLQTNNNDNFTVNTQAVKIAQWRTAFCSSVIKLSQIEEVWYQIG